MRKVSVLVLAVSLVLACGCGGPSEARVRGDFLEANPTCEIVDLGVGEGDASAVYYVIRYRRPGDSQMFEEEWLYLEDGAGRWTLAHKTRARPAR